LVHNCHYLQSRGTIRTRQVRRLCRNVPKVIALSGTPLTIRPAELWPTLNLLWKKEFPSFFSFAHDHCGPRKRPWGWEFKGAVRTAELHKKLKACGMLRRRKEEVLKDLPPKVRYTVPVPLSDPAEYEEAERDFLKWLAKTHGKRKANSAARAEKLVRVGYMLRLTGRLKRDGCEDWVRKFERRTTGKLITFGFHKHMVRGLHQRFPGSEVIDGAVTGKARQRAVDRFTRLKRVRHVFCNLVAGSTNWNGTAAQDVAMTELYWKPGVHTQAEDRPHRVGQTGEVRVWYLLARGTVEEELAELLEERQKVLDRVLDGEVLDDLSLLDAWLDKVLEARR
jgi:SWI/SNF-related matrix-associated actin-dependent regulator 1 of chromatin subfamily A